MLNVSFVVKQESPPSFAGLHQLSPEEVATVAGGPETDITTGTTPPP